MPFRFHCSNCHQRLSVSSEQRGQQVKCPRCHRTVHVPERGLDWDDIAGEGEKPESFSPIPILPPPSERSPGETTLSGKSLHAEPPPIVSVPRYVLYTQGGLLGLVALIFFVFGLIVGSRSTLETGRADESRPVVVSGVVRYEERLGSERSDNGSVVMLLPADERPDEKVTAAESGPEAFGPERNPGVLAMLESLGGDYVRADQQGRYRVRAPSSGRYFLLVISENARRPRNEYPAANDLAELGRYFTPATQLLGQHCYRWQELVLRDDKEVNVTFSGGTQG